ncbi:serine/threonine protein kinase [lymphocystis disease virus-China]|uniref:Serine/threonine protein kinase n=2 Tax=Lymphocystis disease virus 2 TaxID=159183 RepID=A0A6F8X2G5_9VIRU|nr:serine/threonine protein kinase [lymphocystis disease virus-China]AAU10861.1 serine/threonine protein kinase [lymphocystis disease virus-China]BCB67419.1 serine/threonine protein kinase [Lymphocystis disease virus 2]
MNEDCQKFFTNPYVNPKTNRKILKNKGTYKKLVKECGGDPWQIEEVKTPYRYAGIAAFDRIYNSTDQQLKFKDTITISTIFNPRVYTLKNRKCNRFQIRNLVKTLDLDKISHCMSGNNRTFIEKLDDVWPIGSGSFGNVYLVKLKDAFFVVKEALMARCDKDAPESCSKFDEWIAEEIPYELGVQTMANQALDARYTQNFIYTIGAGTCKECAIEIFGCIKTGKCYTVLMEPAAFSLAEILDDLTPEEAFNAMQQLLMGLTVLHGEYGILHRDIKSHNVLVLPGPDKGYFQYRMKDRTFYIPCMGRIYALADFGVSQILNSRYKKINAMMGTRNFEVVRNSNTVEWGETAGLEYDMIPFSTKLKPKFYKNKVYLNPNKQFKKWWKTPKEAYGLYTINHFTLTEDSKPSVPVDLSDMRRFPPQEFVGDLQDVMRIFIGGPQYFQKHHHYKQPLKHPLFHKIKYMTLYDPIFGLNLLYLNPIKYVYPDVLVAFLFPELSKTHSDTVDHFSWDNRVITSDLN